MRYCASNGAAIARQRPAFRQLNQPARSSLLLSRLATPQRRSSRPKRSAPRGSASPRPPRRPRRRTCTRSSVRPAHAHLCFAPLTHRPAERPPGPRRIESHAQESRSHAPACAFLQPLWTRTSRQRGNAPRSLASPSRRPRRRPWTRVRSAPRASPPSARPPPGLCLLSLLELRLPPHQPS